MIITINHIKQTTMCTRGARVFFNRHNLDWSDFLKNGINEEAILATNDAMARKVVEKARGKV